MRVDTVHQGDADGRPGVYHINAVDTVTQWEVIGATETICERHLVPVLEAMLHQFPFRIRGFHCDNGSEYINHTVAKLLNKRVLSASLRNESSDPISSRNKSRQDPAYRSAADLHSAGNLGLADAGTV